MHARTPLGISVFLTTIMLAMTDLRAAQSGADAENETPPPIPSSGKPEYKIKSLPNDSFKPSEKISEDFPVPFPVDI